MAFSDSAITRNGPSVLWLWLIVPVDGVTAALARATSGGTTCSRKSNEGSNHAGASYGAHLLGAAEGSRQPRLQLGRGPARLGRARQCLRVQPGSEPREVFADDPNPTGWVTGAANVTVHGVEPHIEPSGVGFIVTVDWPHPLPVVTDITIFAPPETVDLGQLEADSEAP